MERYGGEGEGVRTIKREIGETGGGGGTNLGRLEVHVVVSDLEEDADEVHERDEVAFVRRNRQRHRQMERRGRVEGDGGVQERDATRRTCPKLIWPS